MTPQRRERFIAAGVFLTVFTVHAVSPIKTPFDSHWSIPTALSLLREHNFDLDEYRPTEITHGVLTIDGHLVTEYPLGAPLIAAPCIFLFDALVRLVRPLIGSVPALSRNADRWLTHYDATGSIDLSFFNTAELIIASLIVAAAAMVLYRLGRLRLRVGPALLLAFIFAFGTSAWSTASRALWQHGPSMLMLSLGLFCLVRGRERAASIGLAGLPLALAWVCRPTNAIALAVFGTWVLIRHRGQVLRFVLFVACVVLPFFALNQAVYGAPLTSYYLPATAAGGIDFWSAFFGCLVSPSRGVLVFTPLFVFSAWGGVLAHRQKLFDGLEWGMAAVITLHLVMLSRFWCWWGGHCYGPRLFCDMVPLLVVLLVPVVGRMFPAEGQRASPVLRAAFATLLLLSVAIHFRGATTWAVYTWNGEPQPVDQARAWDWSDPQFLRRGAPAAP